MNEVNKESPNLITENQAWIKEKFPSCFVEGKLDFDKLKELTSEIIDDSNEKYSFSWAGRTDSIKNTQTPTHGTLIPQKDESVNFEDTENIFIEGENLEVLKLLKKSYSEKIKMIYIDPPYNTGNDFIYKDNFSNSLNSYLEQTGQIKNGLKLTSNKETSGRFHSDWISFMYPRLFWARELLKDDGIIFVSIDDNEINNLRHLLNNIFYEENYIGTFTVQVRYPGKTLAADSEIQNIVESVLIYGKTHHAKLIQKKESYDLEKYTWKIDVKTPSESIELGSKKVEIFEKGCYSITKDNEPSKFNLKEIWASGKILDYKGSSGSFFKDYLIPRQDTDELETLYKVYDIGGDTYDYRYFAGPKREGATKGRYFQGVPKEIFENIETHLKTKPIENFMDFAGDFGNCRLEGGIDFRNGKKPISFLKHLMEMALPKNEDNIVLDFFAGSGSIGHAILDQNFNENQNNEFILIQMPENIEPDENNEFKTISELCKERLRRSIKILIGDTNQTKLSSLKQELGFKVFKLAKSNYKQWENVDNELDLKKQLSLFEETLVNNYKDIDVIYEIIIKEGYSLHSKIEKFQEKPNEIYKIVDGEFFFYVTLDEIVDKNIVENLKLDKNTMFVCLSSAINDSQKINLDKLCKLNII